MDRHRKFAYRYLLYQAMLRIRPIAWQPTRKPRIIPWSSVQDADRVRGLGHLADWLHNMAHFSCRGFKGFDEQQFWQEFEHLRTAHPDVSEFRGVFESALALSRT